MDGWMDGWVDGWDGAGGVPEWVEWVTESVFFGGSFGQRDGGNKSSGNMYTLFLGEDSFAGRDCLVGDQYRDKSSV